MSAEIIDHHGETLTFKISGKLSQSELMDAQKNAAEILQKEGKKHLLVIADHFEGWGKSDWADLSGQMAIDPYIDRMAIVGEKKWESLALLFTGKGIRRVPIEYFAPAELDKAQAWLAHG